MRRHKKQSRHITLPSSIFLGSRVLDKVQEIVEDYDSIVVVTGRKTAKKAGNKVARILSCDKETVIKSSLEEVDRLAKRFKEGEISIAIAVGGGKIIDVTKLAAFKARIPFVSVPTNCSNDGIASPIASISTNGSKKSFTAKPPVGVVADIEIIRKAPYKFTAAGFGDAIAKYTAVRDWELGAIINKEYFGDYASSLSMMVSKMVMNNAFGIRKRTGKGLSVLLESLISSGAAMGIAGSSRPASGSEHKFSHALDRIARRKNLHGLQVGLGAIVMAYLQGADWRRVKNALQTAKCSTTAKELGITKQEAVRAMLEAKNIKPERYTIIEHIGLNEKIAESALKATGVI